MQARDPLGVTRQLIGREWFALTEYQPRLVRLRNFPKENLPVFCMNSM